MTDQVTTPGWMGGDPELGETFVQGKTQETARALLAAADDLGHGAQAVRTVAHGFIVPNDVYDLASTTTTADPGF